MEVTVEPKCDAAGAKPVRRQRTRIRNALIIAFGVIGALALTGVATYFDLKDIELKPDRLHFENPQGAPRALLNIGLDVIHGPRLHRMVLHDAVCRVKDGSGEQVLHARLHEPWHYTGEEVSRWWIAVEVVDASWRGVVGALNGNPKRKGFAVKCDFDAALNVFGTGYLVAHAVSKEWNIDPDMDTDGVNVEHVVTSPFGNKSKSARSKFTDKDKCTPTEKMDKMLLRMLQDPIHVGVPNMTNHNITGTQLFTFEFVIPPSGPASSVETFLQEVRTSINTGVSFEEQSAASLAGTVNIQTKLRAYKDLKTCGIVLRLPVLVVGRFDLPAFAAVMGAAAVRAPIKWQNDGTITVGGGGTRDDSVYHFLRFRAKPSEGLWARTFGPDHSLGIRGDGFEYFEGADGSNGSLRRLFSGGRASYGQRFAQRMKLHIYIDDFQSMECYMNFVGGKILSFNFGMNAIVKTPEDDTNEANDNCEFSRDGVCDESANLCEKGTDCTDCGDCPGSTYTGGTDSGSGSTYNGTYCTKVSEWPERDDVDANCDAAGRRCTALVKTERHNTCQAYCASFGHYCVWAGEDGDADSCVNIKQGHSCTDNIGLTHGTSDMLCTCYATGTVVHRAIPTTAPTTNAPGDSIGRTVSPTTDVPNTVAPSAAVLTAAPTTDAPTAATQASTAAPTASPAAATTAAPTGANRRLQACNTMSSCTTATNVKDTSKDTDPCPSGGCDDATCCKVAPTTSAREAGFGSTSPGGTDSGSLSTSAPSSYERCISKYCPDTQRITWPDQWGTGQTQADLNFIAGGGRATDAVHCVCTHCGNFDKLRDWNTSTGGCNVARAKSTPPGPPPPPGKMMRLSEDTIMRWDTKKHILSMRHFILGNNSNDGAITDRIRFKHELSFNFKRHVLDHSMRVDLTGVGGMGDEIPFVIHKAHVDWQGSSWMTLDVGNFLEVVANHTRTPDRAVSGKESHVYNATIRHKVDVSAQEVGSKSHLQSASSSSSSGGRRASSSSSSSSSSSGPTAVKAVSAEVITGEDWDDGPKEKFVSTSIINGEFTVTGANFLNSGYNTDELSSLNAFKAVGKNRMRGNCEKIVAGKLEGNPAVCTKCEEKAFEWNAVENSSVRTCKRWGETKSCCEESAGQIFAGLTGIEIGDQIKETDIDFEADPPSAEDAFPQFKYEESGGQNTFTGWLQQGDTENSAIQITWKEENGGTRYKLQTRDEGNVTMEARLANTDDKAGMKTVTAHADTYEKETGSKTKIASVLFTEECKDGHADWEFGSCNDLEMYLTVDGEEKMIVAADVVEKTTGVGTTSWLTNYKTDVFFVDGFVSNFTARRNAVEADMDLIVRDPKEGDQYFKMKGDATHEKQDEASLDWRLHIGADDKNQLRASAILLNTTKELSVNMDLTNGTLVKDGGDHYLNVNATLPRKQGKATGTCWINPKDGKALSFQASTHTDYVRKKNAPPGFREIQMDFTGDIDKEAAFSVGTYLERSPNDRLSGAGIQVEVKESEKGGLPVQRIVTSLDYDFETKFKRAKSVTRFNWKQKLQQATDLDRAALIQAVADASGIAAADVSVAAIRYKVQAQYSVNVDGPVDDAQKESMRQAIAVANGVEPSAVTLTFARRLEETQQHRRLAAVSVTAEISTDDPQQADAVTASIQDTSSLTTAMEEQGVQVAGTPDVTQEPELTADLDTTLNSYTEATIPPPAVEDIAADLGVPVEETQVTGTTSNTCGEAGCATPDEIEASGTQSPTVKNTGFPTKAPTVPTHGPTAAPTSAPTSVPTPLPYGETFTPTAPTPPPSTSAPTTEQTKAPANGAGETDAPTASTPTAPTAPTPTPSPTSTGVIDGALVQTPAPFVSMLGLLLGLASAINA
jgi:hypothetical protein